MDYDRPRFRDLMRQVFGGLTDQQIAEETGISQPWSNAIRNGRRPSARTLAQVLTRLGTAGDLRAEIFRAARFVDPDAVSVAESPGSYAPAAFADQLRPHLERIQAKYGVGELMLNFADVPALYATGPEGVAALIERRICERAGCSCQP